MAQHQLLYFGLGLLIAYTIRLVVLKIKFSITKSYINGYADGFKQASDEHCKAALKGLNKTYK
ncbi:MAG: hypothetical protein ACOVNU_04050 [Candidatus Kapaibacteriota bacterium]